MGKVMRRFNAAQRCGVKALESEKEIQEDLV